MDFVLDPQCKPLEGFNVQGVTQSDLFFEELALVVSGERKKGTKVKAVTMAWEANAEQQGAVRPSIDGGRGEKKIEG